MKSAAVLAPVLFLSLTGCEQLTATVSGVSVLMRTPELAAADGMPTALVVAMGSSLTGLTDSGSTGAFAVAGDRGSVTNTSGFEAVSGAAVKVEWMQKRAILCEASAQRGTYQGTSVDGACGGHALEYAENAEYQTVIDASSDTYRLYVTAPAPVAPSQVAFLPTPTAPSDHYGVALKEHAQGSALTVDWSAAGSDRPAFVTLFRVRFTGSSSDPLSALSSSSWSADSQNPIFDNFPQGPADYFDLLVGDPDTSVVIPGGAFEVTGLYVLVVTPTEVSREVTTNLALGSGALAGAGTAFAFWVD